MGGKRIKYETELMICSDYLSGMAWKAIAERFGISERSIANVLIRRGVPTRPPESTREEPSERDRKIIELYASGMFQSEIAERTGLSQRGVGKILKKHGAPSNQRRISEEEKDLVATLYQSGKSSREIGRELHIDYTSACRILRDRGIERRTRRKWFFDEAFFQRSDDRVAYWMGFLMADGNLSRVGNTWTLSLALNSVDRHSLECLCQDLNLSCDVLSTRTYRKTRQLVTLELTHRSLQDWLLPWGIIPRKSYNFVEPTIPLERYPGFLRGWFDGDGSVRMDKRTHQYMAVLVGNLPGMEWYEQALRKIGFRGKTRIRYQQNEIGSAHSLIIGRRDDVFELYDLLKVQEGLRLDRKWDKVHAGKEEKAKEGRDHEGIKKRVVAAFIEKGNATLLDMALRFGMGKARVRTILSEAGVAFRIRSAPVRVSRETEKAIVDEYAKGLTQEQIGQQVGLSRPRVSTILSKNKVVTIPSHVRRITDGKTSEAVAQDYRSGMSEAEIGEKHGMSTSGVHKVLARMQVPKRPSRRYNRKGDGPPS